MPSKAITTKVSLEFTTNEDTNTRLIAEHMKEAHGIESPIADNLTTFAAHLVAHAGDPRRVSKATSHVHDDKAASSHETKGSGGTMGQSDMNQRAAAARVHALRIGEELPSDLALRKTKKRRTILDAYARKSVLENLAVSNSAVRLVVEKSDDGELKSALIASLDTIDAAIAKLTGKAAPVVERSSAEMAAGLRVLRAASTPKAQAKALDVLMDAKVATIHEPDTKRVVETMMQPEGLMSSGVSLDTAIALIEKGARPATSTRKYRH